MAKQRSYNPLLKNYPDSEKINAVSEGAELLYVRLLAQSDDAGRYSADPAWIAAKLFTARMVAGQIKPAQIQKRLDELEVVGLVVFYEDDGKLYLEMVDVFKRHRADVAIKVAFPEPGPDSYRSRNGDVTDAGRTRDGDVSSVTVTATVTEPVAVTEPEVVFLIESNEGFKESWAEWEQHRKEKKIKITPLARKKQMEELEEMGVARAIIAINHSIRNSYTGIYEPGKKDAGQTTRTYRKPTPI